MAISASELKFYKSKTVSDTGANGGRMSASVVASGAVGNLFQAIGESERNAGSVKWRKLFCKNANDALFALTFPKIFLDKFTLGDDIITFLVTAAGMQTNTQADITGSEKEYGGGKLNANVIAGATTMQVLVEDGTDHTFENGNAIRISNLDNVADVGGSEEFLSVVGAPVVAGDVITITFTPPLVAGYSASDSRVMNVYTPGADIVSTIVNPVLTSAAGTFDPAKLLANNIGAVQQVFTLTWTGPTTFNIVGDTLGAVGAGSIGAGAAPNNPDFGKPFFTLQAAALGGSFLAGNTLVFETRPAAAAIWVKRVAPVGAAALSPNSALIQFRGETA